jgi:hypothetical protein
LLLAINYYDNHPLCYYIINAVGYGPARPSVMRPHRGPVSD